MTSRRPVVVGRPKAKQKWANGNPRMEVPCVVCYLPCKLADDGRWVCPRHGERGRPNK